MAVRARGARRLTIGVNPIIIKELRGRMRGPRAFLVLTGFLLLLAAVTFLLYRVVVREARFGPGPLSATVGQSVFAGLAFFELFLVAFITPALTAGTISSEHESLTYDMLAATPLRPISILWGKLISALVYIFLLIFAAVPLASLALIFGGVTVGDMLNALLVLVVSAITFGMIGVFFSALLGRTGRATVLSYLTLLAFVLGPLFLYVFFGILQEREPPRGILMPSPFTAMASVMAPSQGGGGFYGPLGFFFGLLSFGVGFAEGTVSSTRPMWHFTVGFYVFLTAVLFMLSALLIRPVGRRRVGWGPLLLALGVLLALLGLGALVYPLADLQVLFGSPQGPQIEPGIRGGFAPAMPVPMPVPVEGEIEVIEEAEIPPPMEEPGYPPPEPTPASADSSSGPESTAPPPPPPPPP